MSLRDRFFTPTTARAILSWRLLAGAAVGLVLGIAGVGWATAAVAGVVTYGALVLVAMLTANRDRSATIAIDPFAISEPWRQLVQQAQSSVRKLRETVSAVDDGPLRQRLKSITDDVDRGLDQAWAVARRGDEIDAAVRRLDPTALRSRLATVESQNNASPSDDLDDAIASIRAQLATAERLKAESAATEQSLRRSQTKLDELVAHASEVAVGAIAPDTYADQVDDLVIALEALNQAVHEVDAGPSALPGGDSAGGRA